MPRGVPFKKGEKRHPNAGRKKGTKNKKTVDLEAEFQRLTEFMGDQEYAENVKRRIMTGRASHLEKLAWEKKYGKAPLEIKLEEETRDAVRDLAEAFDRKVDNIAARLNKK